MKLKNNIYEETSMIFSLGGMGWQKSKDDWTLEKLVFDKMEVLHAFGNLPRE